MADHEVDEEGTSQNEEIEVVGLHVEHRVRVWHLNSIPWEPDGR